MLEEKTKNALKWILEILNKKNIPYEISGGFAAKLYGSKRLLNDIDLDVPEENFKDILPEVQSYIIFGPGHLNDGKWDLYVMTLNYKGQEIDISGAYNAKVSNKERTKWIPIPADFSKIRKLKIDAISVNIISPEDLIFYKQNLDGEHQVKDIQAINEFLTNNPK